MDKPASDLWVDWSVNGTARDPVWINETGYVDLLVGDPWWGSVLGVYNVTASYPGDDEYLPVVESWIYDNRWGSNMTCYQGNATNAVVGGQTTLSFHLYSHELYGIDLPGMTVRFYINGVLQSASGTTNYVGNVSFSHDFEQSQTYIVTASFKGTGVFNPCNVSVAVTVVPLAVMFSVSSQSFVPGTQLTLNATVMDLRYNNTRYSGSCTVQFYDVDANNHVASLANKTTTTGNATWHVTYPSDNVAHAYKAVAKLNSGTIQIASNPMQLSVGNATRLLLNVTRNFDSTRHVFTFRLLNNSTGSGVAYKNITLTLNQTQKYTYSQKYPNLRTNASGYAWIELYLSPQANNNQTAYNVVASFDGDSASTATATMTTINGTSYAVCTTTQYNTLKPSTNSTSITVTPQTTTGATTLMNMEAMQKKAQDDGWLSITGVWGKSIFDYPWYRLYIY